MRWPWHRRKHVEALVRAEQREREAIRARVRAMQMQLRLIELRRGE